VEHGEAGPPKAESEKGKAREGAEIEKGKPDEDADLEEGTTDEKRQTSPAHAVT
jgi:hypothetical protein